MPKKLLLAGLASALALAVACGGDSTTKPPAAPTTISFDEPDAAADGSTLKVTAPTPTSPADGATNQPSGGIVLTVRNSAGVYVAAGTLIYRFQLATEAGVAVTLSPVLHDPSGTTSLTVPTRLAADTLYRWRARAEGGGTLIGPWSAWVSFRTEPGPPPPTLNAPSNGAQVTTGTPSLIVNTGAVQSGLTLADLTYRFVVESSTGSVVAEGTSPATEGTTSYRVPSAALAVSSSYRWRVRGEAAGANGNWSPYWTFTTPATLDPFDAPGYFRANEVWDPLTKGVTVGQAVNMEFVPGQGARTISNESRLTYNLLQTLEAGEFSFYVYNLNPLSAGDKTKLMSMQEGGGDITTNDYRFTVEKRGSSYPTPGQMRTRIINGDSGDHGSIHDGPSIVPPLVKNVWYFVRLTWGANTSMVTVRQTDASGPVVAQIVTNYPGRQYRPNPHVAHIGAPVGRAGSQDASVPNMTVKGVFIAAVGAQRPAALGGGTVGGIDW
jgi:hypothetical protein